MFLKKLFYGHQGCIYWIKTKVS